MGKGREVEVEWAKVERRTMMMRKPRSLGLASRVSMTFLTLLWPASSSDGQS